MSADYLPTLGTQRTAAATQSAVASQGAVMLDRSVTMHTPISSGHDMDEAPLVHLVGLMTGIRDQNNADKRKVILENFWRKYGSYYKTGHRRRWVPDFRILRLLCPELDRERPVYNLKEASIAKLYCEIHNLSKETQDYIELVNWRDPTAASGGARRGAGNWRDLGASVAGIFPAVLFKVMQKRSPIASSLTVRDLNNMLDDLYRASKTEKKDRLGRLFTRCTAREMEWVVRIILKDLKIGMNHGVILKWFHPDGLRHFDGCQNLKNVCADLADPEWTYANKIKPNDVISPMLAHKCDFAGKIIQISKDLGNKFAIETKYDGDRILCHKEGDFIRFYTRNGNEDPNMSSHFRCKRLLFQGLHDDVSTEDVKKLCERGPSLRGCVSAVHPIQTGRFKEKPVRYAFVEFSNEELCTRVGAQLEDGCMLHGKHAEVKFDGLIVCELRKAIRAHSCVLDGEMLCWDSCREEWVPFGQNKSLALGNNQRPEWNLAYMCFDCLFVQDAMPGFEVPGNSSIRASLPGFVLSENLLSNTYRERRQVLKTVLREKRNWVEIVGVESKHSGRQQNVYVENPSKEELAQAVSKALIDSLDMKCEGILLKALGSQYVMGEDSRSKSNWVKVKPDYVDAAGDHLDLVVLGGYYGDGRRRANISHFLLGVAERTGMTSDDYQFKAICKVGSGYSDQSLSILQQQLEPHWQKYKDIAPPYSWASGYKPGAGERPDVWIEPHRSIILEVKYFCIVPSDKFNIGRTLRFPRCQQIRHDKNWNEAVTKDELQRIMDEYDAKQYGEIVAKAMLADGMARGTGSLRDKRKGVTTKKAKRGEVVAHYKDTNTSHVRKEFSTFTGLEFCVLGVAKPHTKAEIECEIVRHGGTKTQQYSEDTRFIVADNARKGKVGNYIKAQKEQHEILKQRFKHGQTDDMKTYKEVNLCNIDVVHSNWVAACIARRKMVPLRPCDLLWARVKTRQDQSKYYDRFGDSYNDYLEERAELEHVLGKVENEDLDKTLATVGTEAIFKFDGTGQLAAGTAGSEESVKIDTSTQGSLSVALERFQLKDILMEFDDDELLQLEDSSNIFRICRVWVYTPPGASLKRRLADNDIRFNLQLHGAVVDDTMNCLTTHVVVRDDVAEFAEVRRHRDFLHQSALQSEDGSSWVDKRLVLPGWVTKCVKEKDTLCELGDQGRCSCSRCTLDNPQLFQVTESSARRATDQRIKEAETAMKRPDAVSDTTMARTGVPRSSLVSSSSCGTKRKRSPAVCDSTQQTDHPRSVWSDDDNGNDDRAPKLHATSTTELEANEKEDVWADNDDYDEPDSMDRSDGGQQALRWGSSDSDEEHTHPLFNEAVTGATTDRPTPAASQNPGRSRHSRPMLRRR